MTWKEFCQKYNVTKHERDQLRAFIIALRLRVMLAYFQ